MEFNKIRKEEYQRANVQEQEQEQDHEHDQEQEQENENEKARLSGINIIEYYDINPKGKKVSSFYCKVAIVSIITILILCLFFFISLKMVEIVYDDKEKDNKKNKENIILNINNDNITNPDIQEINKIQNLNVSNVQKNETGKVIEDVQNIDLPKKENQSLEENKIINQEIKNNISNNIIYNNSYNKDNKKIKIAFVYSTVHFYNNEKFFTLISDYFMKSGKYDIYYIKNSPLFEIENENKDKLNGEKYISKDNLINIENITNENIDIYILQEVTNEKFVQYYKSLGKKVIGILNKAFMLKLYLGNIQKYQNLINYDLLDSFIMITPDDYYFYKKLQFKKEIYIPNLLTYESSKNQNSALENNNLIMVWKESSRKDLNETFTLMKYIIKELPDVKLTIFTNPNFVRSVNISIQMVNLKNNIFVNEYNSNFTSCLLDYSIYIETSLKGFDHDLNEAKNYGLSIVAYDSPQIQPYKEGIITVNIYDIENMAKEIIKLLKDKEYRKKMGENAKNSLNKYSNNEIVEIWEKLFKSLLSENGDDYKKLQEEIEQKYYNEENAKLNIQKYYNDLLRIYNNTLYCHSLDNITDINYLKNIVNCNKKM